MKKSLAVIYATSFAGTIVKFDIDDIMLAMEKEGLSISDESPIDLSRKTDIAVYKQDIEYYSGNISYLDLAVKQLIFSKGYENRHISLFALAPQPLLIYLGTLLNDKYNIEVFQCHRDRDKWSWKEKEECDFLTDIVNADSDSKIALAFSLSASIDKNRIYKVLGTNVTIYNITIQNPNRHFVTHPDIVNEFTKTARSVMELIKQRHGKSHTIHVFPAMSNSLAIKFGMDYMSNTDNPLSIYDELKGEGFVWAVNIGG